jgi:hypothetical protein
MGWHLSTSNPFPSPLPPRALRVLSHLKGEEFRYHVRRSKCRIE